MYRYIEANGNNGYIIIINMNEIRAREIFKDEIIIQSIIIQSIIKNFSYVKKLKKFNYKIQCKALNDYKDIMILHKSP